MTLLVRRLTAAFALVLAIGAAGVVALYFVFAARVDERLRGERERAAPRIYARPLELRMGQLVSQRDLVARLNDLSYTQQAGPAAPGTFTVARNTVALVPRSGPAASRTVRVTFSGGTTRGIRRLEVDGRALAGPVFLDPPLITTLNAGRVKRRHVPLDRIPDHVRGAVLAIEDQTFYTHPGVNPFRLVAAAFTNAVRPGGAPRGNSTITQQLARMFFQADAFNAELQRGSRSYLRYAQGVLMSLALERRASKDEILELYLNDVYLGQRGSFAIHGLPEAARLFFGKDVGNLTVAEGALIAGVIQSPATRSPFAHPQRATDRRDVVIRAMLAEGYITSEGADAAMQEPLRLAPLAVDHEAPYFVDAALQEISGEFGDLSSRPGPVEIHTTLDLDLQRMAIAAVAGGLDRVSKALASRGRAERPQVALLAADPRTGDILAMVGGRSYNASQFNRAVSARRQPGSVFKPFVYLTALELAVEQGRTDLTPASLVMDEPRVFEVDGRPWEPRNFDEYESAITWRRALAMSRNLGTIDLGERIGFERIAALWRRVGVGTPPRGVPSIALGVFELTPLEVAQAFTLFVNGGTVQPLRQVLTVEADGRTLHRAASHPVRVARPDTTFLVTNMLRSVLDEGTAAGARAAGFAHDAAGKTGTTNDLRDAWFVGFTPELLAVVWVGYDDNRPLGLTGSAAALPIWTEFMKNALSGRATSTFTAPDGVVFVEIDRHTGGLPTPECPDVITEAFLAGTEPTATCELHGTAAAPSPQLWAEPAVPGEPLHDGL